MDEVEAVRLFEMIGTRAGLDRFRLEPEDVPKLLEAMRKHGGATIGFSFVGWVDVERHATRDLSVFEPLMYPEKYEDHGRRWLGISPDDPTAAAIARLGEAFPAPPGCQIGFQQARR